MLEHTVEVEGELSSGVLFYVLNELLLGFPEGDVIMTSYIPGQIGISSSAVLVSIRLKYF